MVKTLEELKNVRLMFRGEEILHYSSINNKHSYETWYIGIHVVNILKFLVVHAMH